MRADWNGGRGGKKRHARQAAMKLDFMGASYLDNTRFAAIITG